MGSGRIVELMSEDAGDISYPRLRDIASAGSKGCCELCCDESKDGFERRSN